MMREHCPCTWKTMACTATTATLLYVCLAQVAGHVTDREIDSSSQIKRSRRLTCSQWYLPMMTNTNCVYKTTTNKIHSKVIVVGTNMCKCLQMWLEFHVAIFTLGWIFLVSVPDCSFISHHLICNCPVQHFANWNYSCSPNSRFPLAALTNYIFSHKVGTRHNT